MDVCWHLVYENIIMGISNSPVQGTPFENIEAMLEKIASLAFSRLFYFHTWHESLIAHCQRDWAPGAQSKYGVVGIILSVRALELMRGLNYWDAMERDIFAPLGIKNILPGGTGFSAENLARMGVLLDNRGKYGNWELFSEEAYQVILPTPLTPYFPKIDKTYGIGLQSYDGRLRAGSYGHMGGCGTQLIVDPEKHLVFAMVRNGQGEDYEKHLTDVMTVLNAWIGNEPE
jgi:CubicO group peptidase (beta-lactamase class C family)